MSFGDKVVLWLHIAVAVVTVGPVTLAISSTPRYIRKRDIAILRYLARVTTIFTVGSIAVLVLGIVLGQLLHEFSKPWLTAAMTLFLVAIVLLVMIIRDQRKAIRAVEEAAAADRAAAEARAVPAQAVEEQGSAARSESLAAGQPTRAGAAIHVASVERGRVAAMGGIVNLIWLVVLALMVWQP
jgi:cbb3-type cytochrome oxidase subunit 3